MMMATMSETEIFAALAQTDDFWHLWQRAGDVTECCGQRVFLPQSGLTPAVNVTADRSKVTCPRIS